MENSVSRNFLIGVGYQLQDGVGQVSGAVSPPVPEYTPENENSLMEEDAPFKC